MVSPSYSERIDSEVSWLTVVLFILVFLIIILIYKTLALSLTTSFLAYSFVDL